MSVLLRLTERTSDEVTLFGHEHIGYDLTDRGSSVFSHTDRISLWFRTNQLNGFLFYSGRVHFSLFFVSFNFYTQAGCIFPYSLFPSIFLLRQGAFFLILCFLQFLYSGRVHFSLFLVSFNFST